MVFCTWKFTGDDKAMISLEQWLKKSVKWKLVEEKKEIKNRFFFQFLFFLIYYHFLPLLFSRKKIRKKKKCQKVLLNEVKTVKDFSIEFVDDLLEKHLAPGFNWMQTCRLCRKYKSVSIFFDFLFLSFLQLFHISQ